MANGNGKNRTKEITEVASEAIPQAAAVQKARDKMISALEKSADDVQTIAKGVADSLRKETDTGMSPEVGIKIAEAIQDYAKMTADFIEDIGHQMLATAESYKAESKALADNIRKCAELESKRALEFTARMRLAGRSIQDVRTQFEKSIGYQPAEPEKPTIADNLPPQ